MKYYLNLQKYQADFLFADISDIKSFARVKIKLLEFLYSSWSGNKPRQKPYVCIDPDDLHRVFLVNVQGHKIVSFGFEFSIKTHTPNLNLDGNFIETIYIKGKNCRITEKEISESLTLLNLYAANTNSLYCYSSSENDDLISDYSKMLFEHILFTEPGYIRYDHDSQIKNTQTHPTNHFDVNYSTVIHYKLGLAGYVNEGEIRQLLDNNLPCVGLNFRARYDDATLVRNKKYVKKGGKGKKKKKKK